jgi:dimeric dUTPase (all-alpha-NTP-PPase superfamily)
MQAELQEHIGHDFNSMSNEQLIAYIKENVLAATDELHEALNETYWKSWAAMAPGFRNREAYVGELIDTLHFLLNLLLAARVTPEELVTRYGGKNRVNHQRQATGYTGTEKCDGPACNRALDEPGILPASLIHWPTGERFCSGRCEKNAKLRHYDNIKTRD